MSRCIDFRDQIRAAKLGAINQCPAGVFLDAVIASLDYIDNELRTARNEFVHHIWSPAGDGTGAVKVDTVPRTKKEPGTGIRSVQHWENRYLGIDEVREVTTDITNERHYLSKILGCFQNPKDNERVKQLSEFPPRLHLLRLKEKQRQMDKARAKQ